MMHYGASKRLAGNEIELGIGIPTIETRASNIPMKKEQCILLCGLTDKDLVEYVGINISIQVTLLVINRK